MCERSEGHLGGAERLITCTHALVLGYERVHGVVVGNHHKDVLDHRIVGEVRSFGMLAAIELVKSRDGPEMFADTGADTGANTGADTGADNRRRRCRYCLVVCVARTHHGRGSAK